MYETKFGSLEQYTSMDEMFNLLRRQFGIFTLETKTTVQDGLIKHIVSITTLIAGKAVEVSAEGNGNVGEAIKQAVAQLHLRALDILNSPEVKGVPGLVKPIVRRAETLTPPIFEFIGTTDETNEPEDLGDEEDGPCEGCEDEDCPCFINPRWFFPGIQAPQSAPSAPSVQSAPTFRFVGTVSETPAPYAANIPVSTTPAAPATKLCCTVAKTKGYKFCPSCGTQL